VHASELSNPYFFIHSAEEFRLFANNYLQCKLIRFLLQLFLYFAEQSELLIIIIIIVVVDVIRVMRDVFPVNVSIISVDVVRVMRDVFSLNVSIISKA
jgi:hypothetical protein